MIALDFSFGRSNSSSGTARSAPANNQGEQSTKTSTYCAAFHAACKTWPVACKSKRDLLRLLLLGQLLFCQMPILLLRLQSMSALVQGVVALLQSILSPFDCFFAVRFSIWQHQHLPLRILQQPLRLQQHARPCSTYVIVAHNKHRHA